jgi:hypothetical protein
MMLQCFSGKGRVGNRKNGLGQHVPQSPSLLIAHKAPKLGKFYLFFIVNPQL